MLHKGEISKFQGFWVDKTLMYLELKYLELDLNITFQKTKYMTNLVPSDM